MKDFNSFHSVSDEDLLQRLTDLVSQTKRLEADLVAHIAEVDERRLYAVRACSSMFTYAVEVLHLSEHEAYERITAARASRKYPQLLEMLADGRLHLSGLGKLAPHLTDQNCVELLDRAAHKTKRQIEELIAEISPKPDAPALIRKVPERVTAPVPVPVQKPELGPDRVPSPESTRSSIVAPKPPVIEVLAPSRYKVQFTASAALREKLERLQALTQEDLVDAIEAAVTERLERLEAKRYGEAKKPRKSLAETDTSPKSRYVPVAVRRMVSQRDQKQCTFVDEKGRRCTEREGLEFHHEDPFGLGGDHDPTRIRLLCRCHNFYQAERDYGKSFMEKYRRRGGRVSETAPGYGFIADESAGTPQQTLNSRDGAEAPEHHSPIILISTLFGRRPSNSP
jgi:hypothetical protein